MKSIIIALTTFLSFCFISFAFAAKTINCNGKQAVLCVITNVPKPPAQKGYPVVMAVNGKLISKNWDCINRSITDPYTSSLVSDFVANGTFVVGRFNILGVCQQLAAGGKRCVNGFFYVNSLNGTYTVSPAVKFTLNLIGQKDGAKLCSM